jgi:3'-5' exoribonuclease
VKSPTIVELLPGQPVTGVFLVSVKEIRQKKSGDPYLSLTLGDRTGDIDAKMWDNVEAVMDVFERNDFVKVTGVASLYNNRMQFTIHRLGKMADGAVDPGDFFPASKRDRDEMYAELRGVIDSLANVHLKALLEAVFAAPGVAEKFKTAPAAKSIHHAWLGGLIEHVLSLCKLCRMVAPNYKEVDVDLLLTGAILHDIGKIDELTYARGFGYSDEGQMVGHIVQGVRMVDAAARQIPAFPAPLKLLVDHLILSHHGTLEFGSPKVPVFAEAMLLHQLDNLDSKMEAMRAAADRDPYAEGAWTGYVPSLERTILKKDRFLRAAAAGAAPVAGATVDVATPKVMAPVLKPAAQKQPSRPETPSLFGERLMGALTTEDRDA